MNIFLYNAAMDFAAFCEAMKTIKSEQEGFALAELTEKNPEFCELLRTHGVRRVAASSCWHVAAAPMFLAQHPTFAGYNSQRELSLFAHNNTELLDLAVKRGLNVDLLGNDLFVNVLPYDMSVEWLSKRTNIAAKIMAVPEDDCCWERVGRYPEFCMKTLLRVQCGEPLARVALYLKERSRSTRKIVMSENIPREYCLANNGALLRALLWNTRTRSNLLKKLIKKCRLSPSDLLSVGFELRII